MRTDLQAQPQRAASVSRPILIENEFEILISRPILIENEFEHLVIRPVLIENEFERLVIRPVLIENEFERLVSRPILIENELEHLVSMNVHWTFSEILIECRPLVFWPNVFYLIKVIFVFELFVIYKDLQQMKYTWELYKKRVRFKY